jgi:hypothetical protein
VSGIPTQLVDSLKHKLDGTPLELPDINLPVHVPGMPAAAAAAAAGGAAGAAVERAELALKLQER